MLAIVGSNPATCVCVPIHLILVGENLLQVTNSKLVYINILHNPLLVKGVKGRMHIHSDTW